MSLSTTNTKNQPILETRTTYSRREEGFVYKNTSLIRRLRISRKQCPKISFIINGVIIPPTDTSLSTLTWDMSEVRSRLRNEIEINDWIRLDSTLGNRSLDAIQYYTNLPSNEFEETIFTKDLRVIIKPMEEKTVQAYTIKEIEIEEEFFHSDIMLDERKK